MRYSVDTFELKEHFILLRARGYSFDRLTKELGKSKQTLVNWAREFEEEIANAKNIELDSLNERFFLTKQAKIEAFGTLLSKIKNEIESRDLSEVNTDKLLDIFLKYHLALETERVEPSFRSSSEIKGAKRDRQTLDKLLGESTIDRGELEAV